MMDLLNTKAHGLANDPDVIDEFLHWFATWVWTAQSNVADKDRALLFQILGMTYLVGDGTWSDERFVREVKGAVGVLAEEPASANTIRTYVSEIDVPSQPARLQTIAVGTALSPKRYSGLVMRRPAARSYAQVLDRRFVREVGS